MDIAKCETQVLRLEETLKIGKNFKNAVVLVWGRQILENSSRDNLRKDSGNSRRLSVVNVINLKHDQLEINVAECSDLRAFVDGRENFYPWPFYGFYANIQTN